MKGIAKIKGPLNPRVGKDEVYEVVAYGKGEINAINHPEIIKWKIFKWHNEQWVEAKGNDKTGKKVTYNFSQKSYAKKILVEAFVHSPELKAPPGLIVKPCLGPRKIKNTQILNVDGSTITKKPKYGQSVLLRVTTENMLGEILKLSVWDRDTLTDTGHDASKNQLLWSGVSKKVNSKGFAEQTIMLSPNMMVLANKSMFDGSEHEYYVLVESKKMKTISTTTQVSNEIQLSPVASRAPVKKPEPEVEVSLMDQATLSIKNAVGFVQTKVEGISNAVVEMFSPDEKIPSCEQKYCIKKGDKSELIREINIRLAGFGGNVPTDEFTDRTEKMIKQFQRDYMKVEETGKVCGNVLLAIDDYQNKFNFNFDSLKCKCGTCSGFGDNTNKGKYLKSNIEAYHRYEYPGINRLLLWSLRAVIFYLGKDGQYSLNKINSGYRCRHHEEYLKKPTTNHMGKALDLHFNKAGERTRKISDIETIRKDIFNKYLGAKWDWKNEKDIFYLESTDVGATTWVHYDVREYSPIHLDDKYFVNTLSDFNGKSIIQLAKDGGYQKTCMCVKVKANVIKPGTPTSGSCEDKFKKVSPIILEHEGGYKNEPSKDKGDPTNKGISWPIWKKYAKEDLGVDPTTSNQKELTDEQATIIYRKRYWEPKGYCEIDNLKVALMIYDWSITSGGAIKEVQKLLVSDFEQTITTDGGMGVKTAEAVNNVSDQTKLLNRIADIRREYYKKGAEEGWFSADYSKGLDNRVTKCLNYEI